MKRIVASAAVVIAVVVFMVVALGSGGSSLSGPTYKIELDSAFGLENGAQFKVAGVPAGKITKIDLCAKDPSAGCANPLHALLTVEVTQLGFGQFHQDVYCESRPQSLIGEYFVECQPGDKGPVLKPGSTIKVNHTFSTIPVDLLNDVLRLPYRERFTLIINELGAAVAGRSGDLQQALRRAVPALTQTDNLLNLLANDSQSINQLNVNANTVITDLANNSTTVQHFIDEANSAATHSAHQDVNIRNSWRLLPGFLEQLKPVMAQLGAATDANLPVVENLNQASGGLARLLRDLPAFSRSALPATEALGSASATGKQALTAARPTISDLRNFSGPVGCNTESNTNPHCVTELAQNLSVVLHDLDNRGRAVEADSRSPGGKGYTGLEALLQYVFNQTLAINTFNHNGHMLAVDGFIDPLCSPYATKGTIATDLRVSGANYRRCYSWLGPNQPGVNETDPSNPGACVPDPGGSMPGERGPSTSACRMAPSAQSAGAGSAPSGAATNTARAATTAPTTASGSTAGGAAGASTASSAPATAASSSSGASSGQAQQLLNYLLAP